MPAVYLQQRRYWRTVTTSAGVAITEYNAGPIDAVLTFVTSVNAPSPTYFPMRWYSPVAGGGTGRVSRRSSDNLSWLDEGAVDALISGASVTQQLAGTASDVSSTPDSVAALWQRGTSITPSAGTVSLPATGGRVFTINAGNFSAISSAQGGREVVFEFAGASTITHNASSMDLPGNANITTAAGDRAAFVNLAAQDATGSNWRCLWGVRDDGSFWGTVPSTQTLIEAGSNNTFPVTAVGIKWNPGVAKCGGKFDFAAGTDTSFNITSIADTASGRVTVTIATDFSGADWICVATAGSTAAFSAMYTAMAAGSVELKTADAAGTITDATTVSFVGFGDHP